MIGTLWTEVDTHASPYRVLAMIYTLSGLKPGAHTRTMEATRRKNPASAGGWV